MAGRVLIPRPGECYSECNCSETVVRFRVPRQSAGAISGLALRHSPGRRRSQGALPVFGPSRLGLLYWLPCHSSRGRIARAGPWRRVNGSSLIGSALPAAVPRGRGRVTRLGPGRRVSIYTCHNYRSKCTAARLPGGPASESSASTDHPAPRRMRSVIENYDSVTSIDYPLHGDPRNVVPAS